MLTTITERGRSGLAIASARSFLAGNFSHQSRNECSVFDKVSDQGAAKHFAQWSDFRMFSARAAGFLGLSTWLALAGMAWCATPPIPAPPGPVTTSSPAGSARYPLAPEALGLMLQVLG